jgi:hypothetical protein
MNLKRSLANSALLLRNHTGVCNDALAAAESKQLISYYRYCLLFSFVVCTPQILQRATFMLASEREKRK